MWSAHWTLHHSVRSSQEDSPLAVGWVWKGDLASLSRDLILSPCVVRNANTKTVQFIDSGSADCTASYEGDSRISQESDHDSLSPEWFREPVRTGLTVRSVFSLDSPWCCDTDEHVSTSAFDPSAIGHQWYMGSLLDHSSIKETKQRAWSPVAATCWWN